MENKEFKKIVTDVYKSYGFKKNSKFYYKSYQESTLKFDFQKPNFSNGWYINYSIVIKALHFDEKFLESWTQDLSGRVQIEMESGLADLIDLDNVGDITEFKHKISKEIMEIIDVFEQGGLRAYIDACPEMLCTATIWAQEYLLKKGYIQESKE